ncbi:MAG TPA: ornithine cyclodeaminase family protein [Hyphomicrobiaceae bacterium]|nr:ornithine cyclodeaminase family protein [Hyphomicrobiaceae bacterium]
MSHGTPLDVLTLSAGDVARLIDPKAAIDALAKGFEALSRGEVQVPPRPMVESAGKGFAIAMLASAPGQNIALKLVSVFGDNARLGLPSHHAVINLLSPETGQPVATMDGGVITAVRTAAASMVTVRALARPEARIATVIGGGVQGRSHVELLSHVRDFAEIRVASRRRESAEAIAAGIARTVVTTDIEGAVRASDVICLCSSSDRPVIEASWVKSGTHITSVGFVAKGGELPPALIDRARLFVESKAAFSPPPVGASELAGLDPARGAEIGEMLLGLKCGRQSADEITIYKSMGNAMEDLVLANLVYAAAKERGIGRIVAL